MYESQPLETFFENTTSKPLMKSKALVCVLIVLVIIGYIASPYISINGLFSSIRSGDIYALKKHINLVELKSSLKDEIQNKVLKELGQKVKENGEGDATSSTGMRLAPLFAPALVDGVVDKIVTPGGLSAFMIDPRNAINSTLDQDNSEKSDHSTSFDWKHVEHAFFTGLTEFEVRTDSDITLQFSLSGLSWKLDGLILPDKETRKRRLENMSKNQLIAGYWKSEMALGLYWIFETNGSCHLPGFQSASQSASYIIEGNILKIKYDSKAENKVFQNSSYEIKLLDDEKMTLGNILNKNEPTITFVKSTFKDKKKSEERIHEKYIKSKSESVLTLASTIAMLALSEVPHGEIYNLNDSKVRFGYPCDLNAKTKNEYIQIVKKCDNNIGSQLDDISKYFDIANTSSLDRSTAFLISKTNNDGIFNDECIIITKDGDDCHFKDRSSSEFKSSLPSRDPAILPEN